MAVDETGVDEPSINPLGSITVVHLISSQQPHKYNPKPSEPSRLEASMPRNCCWNDGMQQVSYNDVTIVSDLLYNSAVKNSYKL